MIVTIAERKARAIDRLTSGAALVQAALAMHAVEHGGRYVVFGSFARGEMRPDSDFDVMVDFPVALERVARDVAERACRTHGLVPDVLLKSEVTDELMRRITRDGLTLS